MRAGSPHGRTRWMRRGTSALLLGAFLLALVSGALLGAQRADAARATYAGISLRALTSTDTPTPIGTLTDMPTDIPTATPIATDTPTDTPTATDTPVATDTPTLTPTSTPTPIPIATPQATLPPPTTNLRVLTIGSAESLTGQQKYGNWCGIATITFIANYLKDYTTQPNVAGLISDTSSTSEWGAPKAHYSSSLGGWIPGVTADIAYDFGTDPRSLAEAATLATGWQYHAKVDTASAWDATVHIVADLIHTQQPISVFVDHGQHSVIVYGVKSTNDPVKYPSSITDIYVWDPGTSSSNSNIQSSPRMEVPINTWLYGILPNGSDYFKYPYAANVYNHVPYDPDPAVGPYTFEAAKYNHLWIGHYVWVSSWGGVGLNADWEVNQYGALIRGLTDSGFPATPAGYTGPSVPMPNNIPPPPPPVQSFSYKPLPKPQPKVVPTPTPKPTPKPKPTQTPLPTLTPLPPPTPTLANDPSGSRQAACALAACLFGALPPGWLLALAALLLVGALLFSVALLPSRRVRLATATTQPARSADVTLAELAAGEAAPPLIGLSLLANEETPTAVTPAEMASAEETPAPVAEADADAEETPAPPPVGPVIVPVLEAPPEG